MRYTRVKDKNGEIHLAAFEKEDKVFFLDELFPELKGKSLIDFVHMVNGDPQKAAQMICAADGLVHRIEEQEMLTPIERPALFEDNAEFGLGMHVGVEKLRDRVQETMEKAIANCTKCSEELKAVMKEWIENRGSSAKSAEVTARLIPLLEACGCDYCKEILEHKDWLVKKSQWIIGGDGWGYDIGYGGVDHVLATGQDVNILVVDTEVYSNTGGQSSKSTPVGAVAKFASSGKRIRKKDLGAMAMTYGYVYVAQVSIGASQQQLFNVLKEAEAYPGPSLVIAYAPCINHGIKGGMTRTQTVGKEAVACGYWHLWHYNPLLEEQGKNPFVLDSKEPDWSKFREFLLKEVRYTSLQKSFPAEADELFAAAEENAKWRYNGYKRLAQMEY